MAGKELKRTVQMLKAVEFKEVIRPERYSTWIKLIRVTATIFQAVHQFKRLICQSEQQKQWQSLSVQELKGAEMYWYRKVQSDTCKEELQALNKGERISTSSKLLRQDPFYDNRDKVIRVGGRLQNLSLLEEAKHQIILLHGNPSVEKKIMQVHLQLICAGLSTTLTVLRQKIWITQGLRDVKQDTHNCKRCRQQHSKSLWSKDGDFAKGKSSDLTCIYTCWSGFCRSIICSYK